MQAAYEAALDYARNRKVFGQPIAEYELTKVKLGRMVVLIQAARQFAYAVAKLMAKGEGAMEASMVKAYVCKAAEWVAREAMQIHGGYGYAADRKVFGQPLLDYQLTRAKLARMAVVIQASRQFAYQVARLMAKGEGAMEASMVKAYVCRAAEWVTREAMQIHGGMGYAEEFPVSRYFVDARVLSIFEGADEVLALKVIARRLVADAAA